MSKRLEILKTSLENKEKLFNQKLNDHFNSVKQANGQPLNDKKNGKSTLNKWEKQNDSLRNLQESINKTKEAIESEQSKINYVNSTKEILPIEILNLITSGELNQWRKYPNTFFVNGVEKARIVFDVKKKIVSYKFLSEIKDSEQRKKFAKIYNLLYNSFNTKK